MRRLSIWILVLALVLLALCALWFLPRLLREEPLPPESGLAASASGDAEAEPGGLAAGASTPAPPAVPESAPTAAEREPGARDERAAGSADDDADAPGALQGRIVDRTGRAVAGATVLAAPGVELGMPLAPSVSWTAYLPLDVADPAALGAPVPKRATSDGAGRFRVDGLAPGALRLAVRSPAFAPLDRNDLRLASGQAVELGDVTLDSALAVYGRLEDGDGLPIRGAPIVQVDEFADASAPALSAAVGVRLGVTDGRGSFRSPPIGPGPWTIRALGGASLADLTLRGNSPDEGWNLRATMPEAAGISGRIVTRSTLPDDLVVRALPAENPRSPVPFACRADARRSAVARNGDFSIGGLDAGVLYELRAGRVHERFEEESLWSPPAFVLAPEGNARVAWDAAASVTFSLADAHGKSPIAAFEVALDGALPARTSFGAADARPAGVLSVEGVRPLRPFDGAALRVVSRGFQPISQRLELRPGTGTVLGLLTMTPLPPMSVRVVAAETGAPIASALVTAIEAATSRDPSDLPPAAVLTDKNGEARVASFGGAGSRIEIRARGRATVRYGGPFGGGFQAPRLSVRLPRGAQAHVRAVDGDGRAIAGARVEWIEGDWSPNETARDPVARIADDEGRVTFAHLAPGRHAFRVQRFTWSLDSEWTLRELVDGDRIEIELTSLARTALDVRVVDGGVPLAGAPAVLLRRESVPSLFAVAASENPLPPGLAARLDARGAWTFQNVDPGAYVLALGIPGQSLRGCRGVVVGPGSNTLFVDLAQTAVAGTIARGPDRTPARAELFVVDPARAVALRTLGRRRGSSDAIWRELETLGAEDRAGSADESGAFRLLGLPLAEPFLLVARAGIDGLGTSEPIDLRADTGSQVVDVGLQAAGALEIRTSTMRIAAPCTLFAFPTDRRSMPRIRHIVPGRPEILASLEPGNWEVELGADGANRRDRRGVEVVAGEVRIVELSVP
ncbi:MAG TPA: carboxypeptidase-like regulatory domain-containing protein [Planctomycetota bacterium]|jgi:hypothetical protein|nr:carboxypeptidase-like regulatory domain-containing protein [Planctomycetota bacterium]